MSGRPTEQPDSNVRNRNQTTKTTIRGPVLPAQSDGSEDEVVASALEGALRRRAWAGALGWGQAAGASLGTWPWLGSLGLGSATEVTPTVTSVGCHVSTGCWEFWRCSVRAHQQVAKRAYKRACRRAATSSAGGGWYRGRWVSSSDLGNRYVSSSQHGHFAQAVARDYHGGTRTKHLSLISWNAGGLAALQNWLVADGIQICCTQETWWPYHETGIMGLTL